VDLAMYEDSYSNSYQNSLSANEGQWKVTLGLTQQLNFGQTA